MIGRLRPFPAGIASIVLLLVVATGLSACGGEPEAFTGYARTPTPNMAEVSLPAVGVDGSEQPFRFVAEPDHLLLVYFGYTSCPDVCPTTLTDVRRALDDMGDDADRVDLAMATIDTAVDTPEILNSYVRSFVPDATAIRSTDDAALRAATDAFGADYGTEEVDGEQHVYHTGFLYAVDDTGDLVMTWPFGAPSDAIRSDIERLLNGDRA